VVGDGGEAPGVVRGPEELGRCPRQRDDSGKSENKLKFKRIYLVYKYLLENKELSW
jgi:hypothetical protein